MKKTSQALIFILSLTIFLTLNFNAFAQEACVLEWWTDSATSEGSYLAQPVLLPQQRHT